MHHHLRAPNTPSYPPHSPTPSSPIKTTISPSAVFHQLPLLQLNRPLQKVCSPSTHTNPFPPRQRHPPTPHTSPPQHANLSPPSRLRVPSYPPARLHRVIQLINRDLHSMLADTYAWSTYVGTSRGLRRCSAGMMGGGCLVVGTELWAVGGGRAFGMCCWQWVGGGGKRRDRYIVVEGRKGKRMMAAKGRGWVSWVGGARV